MNEEDIQGSIISVKQKYIPQAPNVSLTFTEGNVIAMKEIYDFFNLDFHARSGRENMDIERKVNTVMDFINTNYDTPLTDALINLASRFGANTSDISLLDHFYAKIRFSDSALESLPAQERVDTYELNIEDSKNKIMELQTEIKTSREKIKSAKELTSLNEKRERLQARLQANLTKLENELEQAGFQQSE